MAKMGRPPKPKAEKQNRTVLARFTPGEYRQLKADAEAAGLPVATYLASLWRERRK